MAPPFWERIGQDLAAFQAAGQYKQLRTLTQPMGPVSQIDGIGEVVVLCSNDYLGLANDPQVVAAAASAQKRWGAGTASVRFICGTFEYHRHLERQIAELSGTDDATTYVSCWNANEAVIPTLLAVAGDSAAVISDELNHASIIDAIRLGRQLNRNAVAKVYPHADMSALEDCLKDTAAARHKIVVTDGVFSMEGRLAPLDKIHRLCRDYGALLIVDDSHGVGVCGATGRGIIEHYNLLGQIDCLTGTLGKALGGAAGGYVASRKPLIDLLVQKSRPQLFSNALPPGTAAAATKAIELLMTDSSRVRKLQANVQYMRDGLKAQGFETMDGPSAITPILLGQTAKAIAASHRLLELGVFVIGFGYPVVPEGAARLRVQVSAAHETAHLDRALEAFRKL